MDNSKNKKDDINDENSIYLTNNDTIKGIKFNEISGDNFIKMLKNNNQNGGRITRIDDVIFKIDYLDILDCSIKTFYLIISKEIMNDFDNGIYTNFTKNLYDILNKRFSNSKDDLKKYLHNLKSKLFNGGIKSEDDIKNKFKFYTNIIKKNISALDNELSNMLNDLLSNLLNLLNLIDSIEDLDKKNEFKEELELLFTNFHDSVIKSCNHKEFLIESLITIKNGIVLKAKRLENYVCFHCFKEWKDKTTNSLQVCFDKKNEEKSKKINETTSDISCSEILKQILIKLNYLKNSIDFIKNDNIRNELKQSVEELYADYNSYVEKLEYNKRNEITILFNLKNLFISRLELLEDKVYKKRIEQTYADLENRLKVEIEKRKEKIIK